MLRSNAAYSQGCMDNCQLCILSQTIRTFLTHAGVLASVQTMVAQAYVFCAALQSQEPTGTHSVSVSFPVVQETRPTTADWPAQTDSGTFVYITALVA